MKKIIFSVAAIFLAAIFFPETVFAGQWVVDEKRPALQNGVTNYWWRQSDGSWPAGQWAWIDGDGNGISECYYFNDEGYMLASTITPDFYTVNEKGAWTKDGVVQLYPNAWVPGGVYYTTDVLKQTGSLSINPLDSDYTAEQATHSDLTDPEAYAILMQIKQECPEGTPWSDYELYVSGKRYGYGCAAFIFMVQDRLFGADAKPYKDSVFDMSKLRVGDHLRVQDNKHSVIVLTRGNGYITVCEAAYKHSVHWGRVITENELREQFVYRETYY